MATRVRLLGDGHLPALVIPQQRAMGYRRGEEWEVRTFVGPFSRAKGLVVSATFLVDLSCFGFLPSRLDRLCPFAMTSSRAGSRVDQQKVVKRILCQLLPSK